MKKLLFTILTGVLIFCAQTVSAQTPSYNFYMQAFEEALENQTNNLIFYLESAHLSYPESKEPLDALERVASFDSYKGLTKGYLQSGISALLNESIEGARFYFTVVNYILPYNDKASYYLDQIDQYTRGQISDIDVLLEDQPQRESRVLPKTIGIVKKPLQRVAAKVKKISSNIQGSQKKVTLNGRKSEGARSVNKYVADPMLVNVPVGKDAKILSDVYTVESKAITYFKDAADEAKSTITYDLPKRKSIDGYEPLIKMDDDLWSKQPNTELEVEVRRSIVLVGSNIKRFLVTKDDYLDVERVNGSQIRIESLRRGPAIIHVWDDRGRWTFNILGIIIVKERKGGKKDFNVEREEYVKNFHIGQSTDWSSFYQGRSVGSLEQQSLLFRNFIGIYGESPIGDIDGSASFYKFSESTELVGQSIGLTNATIGPLEDVTIRGWDTSARFSSLSLPGAYFRGFLFKGLGFERNVQLIYLRGQDYDGEYSASISALDFDASYLEGVKIKLFPDQRFNNYSFNFAHGYGDERTEGLKKRVYSVDTNQKYLDLEIHSELAFDEDEWASHVNTNYAGDDYNWNVSLRNVNKDFKTITAAPGDAGEIGAIVRYNKKFDDGVFDTDIDLYRDRVQSNPERETAINVDYNASVQYNINQSTKLRSSFYFVYTPQIISPVRNFRINHLLTKEFEVWENQMITGTLGYSFQRNRYRNSETSEFDRQSLLVGMRMPFLKYFNYNMRYEQSFVRDVLDEEHSTPSAFNAGVGYSRQFTEKFGGNVRFNYRNEQDTDDNFSFLSGTDDVRTSVGITFNPKEDIEIYVDGTLRNVWQEAQDEATYTEMDVRMGVKSSWDLMFGWNPYGRVRGIVWNDLNGNGLYETHEPGVGGINVRVGKKTVKTNKFGWYFTKVAAKKIIVDLDAASLPAGYFISTADIHQIDIDQFKTQYASFGVTSQTALRGLVFVDTNNNRLYDSNEDLVGGAKIILDGEMTRTTDHQGGYSFSNIMPGEHDISIDVNSLPLQYLPKIKVKAKIILKEGATLNYLIPLSEGN
ncbi:MAG: hypothetical protein ACI9F2_000735 [Lysobacterales bacterium]|jgi:hypothetical protein